jgi:hypothetical protein
MFTLVGPTFLQPSDTASEENTSSYLPHSTSFRCAAFCSGVGYVCLEAGKIPKRRISALVRKAFEVPTNLYRLLPVRVTSIIDDSQLNATQHIEEALKVVRGM